MTTLIDPRARLREEFRHHVHALLAAGYERLAPSDYARTEEPSITGDLVQAMKAYIEDPNAPDWVERYEPLDDPPQNVPGRMGKRRPKIDIEIVKTMRGPRPRFRWEAKRLDKNHPVTIYLGSEGMGALLSGYYPIQEDEAGMLGYVQSDTLNAWLGRITNGLTENPKCLFFEGWESDQPAKSLETYRSDHNVRNRSIRIWHTLLLFK